jgi:hypothetical protein
MEAGLTCRSSGSVWDPEQEWDAQNNSNLARCCGSTKEHMAWFCQGVPLAWGCCSCGALEFFYCNSYTQKAQVVQMNGSLCVTCFGLSTV